MTIQMNGVSIVSDGLKMLSIFVHITGLPGIRGTGGLVLALCLSYLSELYFFSLRVREPFILVVLALRRLIASRYLLILPFIACFSVLFILKTPHLSLLSGLNHDVPDLTHSVPAKNRDLGDLNIYVPDSINSNGGLLCLKKELK